MKDRVKLYKGEYAGVWERRFIAAGWPQPLAGLMAHFLTGEGPLPTWPSGPSVREEVEALLTRRVVQP